MNNRKLKLIDFSQGIKSSEVQYNFDVLQEQIDKERISVAGSGIANGLDFVLEDFKLTIKEGYLINNLGQEVYIDETDIEIEKPILIEKHENNLVVDSFNRVYLSEIPYSSNRLTISENAPIEESNIIIKKSGTEDKISLASIDGRVLNLKAIVGTLENTNVNVNYFYTFKRRDVIYIDKSFHVKHRQGLTSPSPSIPELNEDEYNYILGYIEVNGHAVDVIENTIKASVNVIKEFKSIRNVYTDNNNKLYLCGTPFESLKVIHLVEPTNPEENTFWYDSFSNELKIWKATDSYTFAKEYVIESSDPNYSKKFKTDIPYLVKGKQLRVYLNKTLLNQDEYMEGSDLSEEELRKEYIFSSEFKVLKDVQRGDVISYRIDRTDGFMEWVAINKSSYVDIEERFMWTPEMIENEEIDCEHDKQHFFFHATKNKNCLYTPDKNCLEILINQLPLHSDQYEEITMIDSIASENANTIKSKLVKYYGYNDEFDMANIHEEYENIGIGFKLSEPLDKNSYVEVKVKQRVNSNPLAKRFQRSATFVAEGTEEYKQYSRDDSGVSIYNPPIFKTSAQYRYDENQLEVFLNGRRLEKNIEWKEIAAKTKSLKAVPCDSFEILPPAHLNDGDRISYKLTTSIFSYDHVEALLNNFNEKIKDCEDTVLNTKKEIDELKLNIEEKIELVDEQIQNITDITNNLDDTFIKKDEVINKENISSDILSGVMNGSFYHTIVVTEERKYNITNICSEKDLTLLFNLNDSNGNKILKRGNNESDDYNVSIENEEVVITLLSTSIREGHILYLTGVKFGI